MISGNYRELTTPEQVSEAIALHENAWKDPSIPLKQWQLAVVGEIEAYRKGAKSAPFDAFVQAVMGIPDRMDKPETTLLDVGASSGYYSEVLQIAGYKFSYHALDFSEHFKKVCNEVYPKVPFTVGDARSLPFPDKSFDIVVSGCCMLHLKEYPKVIEETARVARHYAIFHRTPVYEHQPTRYFIKEAYGVPCLEIHFNEDEIFGLFTKNRLRLKSIEEVFWQDSLDFGHRTYLCEVE